MSDYRGGDDGRPPLRVAPHGRGDGRCGSAAGSSTPPTWSRTIPSRHTPSFEIDRGVRFIPPNDLVDLAEPAARLHGHRRGQDRDGHLQLAARRGCRPRPHPLDPAARRLDCSTGPSCSRSTLVGSYMQLQARGSKPRPRPRTLQDFARRLEADGVLHAARSRPSSPTCSGARPLSTGELDVAAPDRGRRPARQGACASAPSASTSSEGSVAAGPGARLRRLHRRRRATDRAPPGLRARPHHAAIRDDRDRALGRRDDRRRRGDAGRRRREEPPLPARGLHAATRPTCCASHTPA